jgi:DNA polymerase III epsilon subunit-like protein
MPPICFLYTDTNGLHKCHDYPSTKNLYKYARLIAIHYMIGNYSNGKFTISYTKNIILKPKTINFDSTAQKFHKITMEDAEKNGVNNIDAINELKNDLSKVNIIIGHSLPFHIKAIQVECFRTAIDISFSKYICIDLMSFGHTLDYPKLVDLLTKYKIDKNLSQLEQYKELFLILYKDYSKTVSPQKKIKEEADECDFID